MLAKLIVSPELSQREQEIAQILSNNGFKNPHPDLLYFPDEVKLGVEETKQIRGFLSLKPYQAKGRAVVLVSAHNLTLPAQNSLLKTLEEPPEQALILLGVNSENSLLPTILSRCEVVTLATSNEPRATSNYLSEIEKLETSTPAQRFQYIEKLEDKEGFLKALVSYYRERLHKDPSLVGFSKKLIQAEQWADSNVNIRATLEYLMLEMPVS